MNIPSMKKAHYFQENSQEIKLNKTIGSSNRNQNYC